MKPPRLGQGGQKEACRRGPSDLQGEATAPAVADILVRHDEADSRGVLTAKS